MNKSHVGVVSLTAAVFFAAAACAAAEVGFSRPPQVVRDGGGAVIEFAVTAPTDVEVAVLDAAGRVVRHLAAGVLGGQNPPPAPLAAGLAQRIAWDGADDGGKPVAGAAQVRVRLGLGAKFEGVFGENRFFTAGIKGMATDAQGRLYILSSPVGNRGSDANETLKIFDRAGNYLRTLLPMPANLPIEKVAPFDVAVVDDEGHFIPRNRRGTWPQLYPGLSLGTTMDPRVGADGIVLLNDGKRIGRIGPDGGAVDPTFAREYWAKAVRPNYAMDRYNMTYPGYAVHSPDGAFIYMAGVFQHKPWQKDPIRFPRGRIYRMKLDGGFMEPFADVTDEKGAGAALAGLTFDAAGNLLVCDRSGGRVVVLDAKGKQVGAIPVADPELVACHRTTGALYVLCIGKPGYFKATKSLVKFTGWKDGREAARLRLRTEGDSAVLALDDSADVPVLWVGIDRSKGQAAWDNAAPAAILRLEDRGGELVPTEHAIQWDNTSVDTVTRLAVHPDTDMVICRGEYAADAGFAGLTGERVKLPFTHCTDMGVGLDGLWYIQTGYSWDGPIQRYDKDLRSVDIPGLAATPGRPANAVGSVFGRWGNGWGTMGVAADRNGRVISMQQVDQHTVCGDCVVAFGPDGKPLNPGRMAGDERIAKHGHFPSVLIGPIAAVPGGVGVDMAGNVYFGIQGLPMDHKPPAGFEKDEAYQSVVGTILKMAPGGGSAFRLGGPLARPPEKEVPIPEGMTGIRLIRRGSYPCGPFFVENAVKAYPGLGSISGTFGTGCRCRQPMFQVDGWGRLWIPNAITCSVQVVDNEANPITQFGRYANCDSAGPDSPVSTPDIPLGWPEAVGVSRTHVYVADVLNRRIVRLAKTWSAEAAVAVK